MIFTTINPNGYFEVQNNALLSWSSKFDVYSVNTSSEIEKIKDLYPYIKFIETDDTYDYNGKIMIKLNGVLNAIKKVSPRYFCIINSDIILDKKVGKSLFNDKYLYDGVILATRYEIDKDKPFYAFVSGYDMFIFDIKYIDILFNNNYVIGLPWWDFWVPLISYKALLKIYHIKNQVIYHKTHETNYEHDSWVKFGGHLYKDIVIDLMKLNGNPDVSVEEFCSITKKFIESKHINIKIK